MRCGGAWTLIFWLLVLLAIGCSESPSDNLSEPEATARQVGESVPESAAGADNETVVANGEVESAADTFSTIQGNTTGVPQPKEPDPTQGQAIARIKQVGGSYGFNSTAPDSPVTVVSLFKTKAANEDVAYLKNLHSLRSLNLDGTQITDAGLAHLKELREVQELVLANTQITDAGLAHLRGLNKLQTLSLFNTGITDQGLEHLKGLTKLRHLYLINTQVSDECIREWKSANPDLIITGGRIG